MKRYKQSGGTAPPFLTSVLDWGMVILTPRPFALQERAHAHKAVWIGPRASLDATKKEHIVLAGNRARSDTDWAIPAPTRPI
jgi:hypothetical protein